MADLRTITSTSRLAGRRSSSPEIVNGSIHAGLAPMPSLARSKQPFAVHSTADGSTDIGSSTSAGAPHSPRLPPSTTSGESHGLRAAYRGSALDYAVPAPPLQRQASATRTLVKDWLGRTAQERSRLVEASMDGFGGALRPRLASNGRRASTGDPRAVSTAKHSPP